MAFLKTLACLGGGAAVGYLGWKALSRHAEIARYKGRARGKTFVIVGAGFAGAATATELARLLPAPGNGHIILIDEDSFLLFTPMLTEAAGGEVDPRHIVHPVTHISKRVHFVEGRVTHIDLEEKTVEVDGGTRYRADQMVIALGSITDFHGLPGFPGRAIPMKRVDDATKARDQALRCMEQAAAESDPGKRRELLTFVVAGGGFSGVETIAALNDLLRDTGNKDIRTILICPEHRLLPELTPDLAAYAAKALMRRGVEVRVNTKVAGASGNVIDLEGGERIAAGTLIWAAGVRANPLVEQLGCEKGKEGAIKVDEFCRVPSHPGVWAMGDCASIPEAGGFYAPTAQNATREGTLVGRNMAKAVIGEKAEPFHYRPVGELALVGKHTGVARVYGMNFSGFAAWALWRATYLAKMPGLRQKIRIVADWTKDLLHRGPALTH